METTTPRNCHFCQTYSAVVCNGYDFRFKCRCPRCGTVWKVFNRKIGKFYPIEIIEQGGGENSRHKTRKEDVRIIEKSNKIC